MNKFKLLNEIAQREAEMDMIRSMIREKGAEKELLTARLNKTDQPPIVVAEDFATAALENFEISGNLKSSENLADISVASMKNKQAQALLSESRVSIKSEATNRDSNSNIGFTDKQAELCDVSRRISSITDKIIKEQKAELATETRKEKDKLTLSVHTSEVDFKKIDPRESLDLRRPLREVDDTFTFVEKELERVRDPAVTVQDSDENILSESVSLARLVRIEMPDVYKI